MIKEFLQWWRSQLADLIPAPLRAAARGSANALIAVLPPDWNPASFSAGDLLFIQRRNGRDLPLGRLTTGGEAVARLRTAIRQRGHAAEVRLRVPAHLLLERQVVLPLATEREMNNVLRFEMDRLTPFRAEQVFWAAAIERRDPARDRLILRLATIPKAPLAATIAALNAAGLATTAIEVAVPGAVSGGSTRLISLRDPRVSAGWGRRGPRLAAGACAVLALVAAALPFILQSRRAAALDHEMARLAPRVEHAALLRQRLASAAATGDVIAAARVEIGDPLAVLAAVTAALPDNSYLNELTLNHRQLEIVGQSGAAAGLLAALSAYPILTDVAFSAPVTRDAAGAADLFSIQTSVAPQ